MTSLFDIATRNWWVFVVRGVLAIVFGIVAWAWPDLTLTALVIVFGAYALVDGVFAVVNAIATHAENRRWWAELLVGLAGIVVGIVTWVWPGITALALLYVIASWAVVSGVFEIAAAIELRREIENEWLLGLGGLASILLGLLLFIFPGSGALGILWLIGAYGIVFGVVMIGLGFRLRGMRNTLEARGEFRGPGGARPVT